MHHRGPLEKVRLVNVNGQTLDISVYGNKILQNWCTK